jgi:hypothetical protein
MMAGLTRIERARGGLDAAKLSAAWLATMRSRALLLAVIKEGCDPTLDRNLIHA